MHVTIFRSPVDGRPEWATVTGADQEADSDVLDALSKAIKDRQTLLCVAPGVDLTIEVV